MATRRGARRNVAIIRCNYEEFEPETYEGMEVTIEGKVAASFNTGDSMMDLHDAIVFCLKTRVMPYFSSTVDHFLVDKEKSESNGS